MDPPKPLLHAFHRRNHPDASRRTPSSIASPSSPPAPHRASAFFPHFRLFAVTPSPPQRRFHSALLQGRPLFQLGFPFQEKTTRRKCFCQIKGGIARSRARLVIITLILTVITVICSVIEFAICERFQGALSRRTFHISRFTFRFFNLFNASTLQHFD